MALSSDVIVLTDADFDEKISHLDVILVLFYAPWDGRSQRLQPEYESAARILKSQDTAVPLGKVNCTDGGHETRSRFDVSGYPTLKVFRNGEFSSDYNGLLDSDSIVKFMRLRTGPSSKLLVDNNGFEKVISGNIHAVIGFFTDNSSPFFKEFLRLADINRDEYLFAHSFSHDVAKNAGYEIESFGFFKGKLTTTALEPANVKYTSASRELRDMESFIQGFAVKVEADLKSEEIPATNTAPVKVVVAKTFKEIVNDATKDVLIQFYAPFSPVCKNLAPKYDELAEKLKDEPSLVIAKMNATTNDAPPPYTVAGFPTIYYAPKNDKDCPKKYTGGLEVDDFMNYLKQESTDGLKGSYDTRMRKITDRIL